MRISSPWKSRAAADLCPALLMCLNPVYGHGLLVSNDGWLSCLLEGFPLESVMSACAQHPDATLMLVRVAGKPATH